MTFRSVLLLTSRILKPKESAVSHARRSLLGAVVCIALSMIPLVVVLVVSDGMIEGITSRIVGLSSYHAQIAQDRTFADPEYNMEVLRDIAEEASTLEGVTGTFIERQGSALAAGKGGRSGAAVRSVEERFFTESAAFSQYVEIIDGEAAFPEKNSTVIGKKIAELLDLSVGDTIRLITARTTDTGSVLPKVSSFKVTGIVSSGYQEIDALWVFIPLETGFDYLATSASTISVGIETEDPFGPSYEPLALELDDITPYGFMFFRWSDLNSAQYENFASTRVMLLFVMVLIVLVASINISSALVMLVLERRKEIAILKSLGASEAGVSGVYILTGAAAGFAGTVPGILLGVLCAVNVNSVVQWVEKVINEIGRLAYSLFSSGEYADVHLMDPAFYLEKIPVTVSVSELLIIAAGTVLLSVLVSVIPAVRAGKDKPLNILRKV
ncbi:MAG: ABC transporter permease [Treponema sp.]|nr:ABC transporter permease [Candidatus Treponema caballi]